MSRTDGRIFLRPFSITNILAWSMLLLSTVLAILALPPWFLICRLRGFRLVRAMREGAWLYGRFYMALLRPVLKIDFSRQGGPDGAAGLIVVNHQSWLDPYLLCRVEPRNFTILIRSWPFKRLFFFGPFMRLAEYIETEGAAAEEILAACRRELAAGASIVCFPEGTRSRDGSLGRFRSGIFKLAVELDVPVIPLVIRHSGLIMPKGSLIFRPGRIRMEMGPPIEPGRFVSEPIAHGALRRFVRRRFQKALDSDTAGLRDS